MNKSGAVRLSSTEPSEGGRAKLLVAFPSHTHHGGLQLRLRRKNSRPVSELRRRCIKISRLFRAPRSGKVQQPDQRATKGSNGDLVEAER